MRRLSTKLAEAMGFKWDPEPKREKKTGMTWFTFPAELRQWERDLPYELDVDWRVEVDYGEDGEFSDNPWFTFYRAGIYYGTGQLGFRKGGVGRVHGPSHPSLAVWGPYIRPDPRMKKDFRVPEDVQAYAIRWAEKRKLIHAPSGTFVHPRGRPSKRPRRRAGTRGRRAR